MIPASPRAYPKRLAKSPGPVRAPRISRRHIQALLGGTGLRDEIDLVSHVLDLRIHPGAETVSRKTAETEGSDATTYYLLVALGLLLGGRSRSQGMK